MPRSRGDKEYILPVSGLNTEANLLHFPQEFAADVLNMETDYNPQQVRPRKGMVVDGGTTTVATRNTSEHDIAIHSFLWENINDDPELNKIVVQVGRYIYFLDDTTYSSTINSIDINESLSGTAEGTIILAEPQRVDFTNVKGNLLICANALDPILVRTISNGLNVEATSLTLQMRDLLGVDDGLEVDERPPGNGTALETDHLYNLYNQGWYMQRREASGSTVVSNPITVFDAKHDVYPSNADIPYLGMIEDGGDLIFDPEWLKDQTFGSTPAAKGHYIVDIFNINRAAIIASPQSSTSGQLYDGSLYWTYRRALLSLVSIL